MVPRAKDAINLPSQLMRGCLELLSFTKLKLRTAKSGSRKWEWATAPGARGCCLGHAGNREDQRHLSPFSLAGTVGQQQHSSWQNFADGYFLPNCHLSWWGKMILSFIFLLLFLLINLGFYAFATRIWA